MSRLHKIILALVTGLTIATPLLGQGTESKGYFRIFNDTDSNFIIGFYSDDGSGLSENWLAGVEIRPGNNTRAAFTADVDTCQQQITVGWMGRYGGEVLDDPIEINLCTASNLYLGDNEIRFD